VLGLCGGDHPNENADRDVIYFYVLLVIFKLSAKCVRVCSVHCVILTAKFDCTEISAELFIIQDGPEKSRGVGSNLKFGGHKGELLWRVPEREPVRGFGGRAPGGGPRSRAPSGGKGVLPTEMRFGRCLRWASPRNHVLKGGQDHPHESGHF